jgi:pyoverdine/dityrosine biosynthesis protein Dit1/AcrR family transcriptional regulator
VSERKTQTRSQRSRLRVLESALSLFSRRGYDATTFQQIAADSGVSVGLVCRYFPTKEHFALALYDRLATDLESWAVEMPAGTIAARVDATMRQKLALMEPHRRTLIALAVRALDPEARAHVFGADTEVVRSKVAGVFSLAVCGATDAPAPEQTAALARILYGVHLLLVLLHLQEGGGLATSTDGLLDLLRSALGAHGLVTTTIASAFGQRIDQLFGRLFATSRLGEPGETARVVLDRIIRRRRVLPGTPVEASEAARALHVQRVQYFVDAKQPIELVLPAFPAKAPNANKVLGRLPDLAEQLALESLASLLSEIAEAHPPGAELIICSDGHVFADVVGVRDADVAAYRRRLEEMIHDLGAPIRVFGLEDAFGPTSPAAARRLLLETYGVDLEEIRARADRSPSHRAQLDGIHRFLFEDEIARDPDASRSQVRKRTREPACEVVRRSEAWGQLVAAAFPRALRLSIHPQPDISSKIGISLLATDDAWLTPWHAVALFEGDRVRLVHRSDADALGAVVVDEDGAPSYMEVRS